MQAEVLQNWGEGVLAVCATLPDAELSLEAEQQASSLAQSLFKQSVETYQQVSKHCVTNCTIQANTATTDSAVNCKYGGQDKSRIGDCQAQSAGQCILELLSVGISLTPALCIVCMLCQIRLTTACTSQILIEETSLSGWPNITTHCADICSQINHHLRSQDLLTERMFTNSQVCNKS